MNTSFSHIAARCLLFGFVALVYFVRYEGPVESYWDTFVAITASHMVNRPVEFVEEEGSPLYNVELPGSLPGNLIDRSTFGVISKDQRLGASVVHAVWFLLFNLLGFRILFALLGVAVAVAAHALGRLYFDEPRAILCAVLAALNPYILSCNQLSPSLTGSAMALVVLYLICRGGANRFLLGLLFGCTLAVVEVAVFFMPAVLYRLWKEKARLMDYGFFVLGAAMVFAPFLYWNTVAYGGLLVHPTQDPGLSGFRPVFPHRFLFWTFEFNGLLNFPFHDSVVRTPHFPFPAFLYIPLVLIRSFGALLIALALPGLLALRKRAGSLLPLLVIWTVPFFAFLLVQENLDEWKITYSLFLLPPLAVLIASGAGSVTTPGRRVRNLLVWLVTAGILVAGTRGLRGLEFEVDSRWYERFPKALAPENEGRRLLDEERGEWYIYHTAETPEEYAEQKAKMTRGNLLPAAYRKQQWKPDDLFTKLREEWRTERIQTIDMWERIYGTETFPISRCDRPPD